MKSLWWIVGASVVAVVMGCGDCARSGDIEVNADIARAVANTTTVVEQTPQILDSYPQQKVELAHSLMALPADDDAVAKRRRGARCYYNCPPPVGSVTASPNVVRVQGDALGSVTIHWRWDQSSTQAASQHGCLWVSGREEGEAHLVQCELPGHTYATTLKWIGAGGYVFRVAPGRPEGPYTRPVAGLYQLAQAIVVGVRD